MTETILILGGTKEAAERAHQLVKQHPQARIITSLAGRTKAPDAVPGEVRIGGFDGVAGLVDWLRANTVTQVIDATHPFATQISAHAMQATSILNIPLDVVERPPWQQQEGDDWMSVKSTKEASTNLPPHARAFLALGSQYLEAFCARRDVHFIIRMVDTPDTPQGFSDYTLVIGKPSPDWEAEATLLRHHHVSHIVCRNSGGTGAYAKIKAARMLRLPVIMIQRPQLPNT